MKKGNIIAIVALIIIVILFIIKILKWPLIIASIALLAYLGWNFLFKKKE
ncbi:MAG: hypothetical protein U0W24_18645 [Bacteroidales bacterium]